MEKNNIKSTDLFIYPSFLKGVARVGSSWGQLDEYNYKLDPDTEAIKRDWIIIGLDIGDSIQKHEQETKKQTIASRSNSCTAA